MSHTLADYGHVLARFDAAATRDGRFAVGVCPVHDDAHPSLRFWVSGDTGRLLYGCPVCDTRNNPQAARDIARAAGLDRRDFLSPSPESPVTPPPKPVLQATYRYRTAAGDPAYEARRMLRPGGGKFFQYRRPDPDAPGGWAWNLDSVARVVYRLPELLAEPLERLVWLAEGEKKADALAALGLVATSAAGGSDAPWTVAMLGPFAGRHVAVLPDNDPPGRAYAHRLLSHMLAAGAASVTVVTLPGLPPKGDVCDHLAAVAPFAPGDTEFLRDSVTRHLKTGKTFAPAPFPLADI